MSDCALLWPLTRRLSLDVLVMFDQRHQVMRRRPTNLLIVESLTVKDVSKVVSTLVSIGQAAVRSAVLDVAILATGAPRYDGASHLLNGAHSSEGLWDEQRVSYGRAKERERGELTQRSE